MVKYCISSAVKLITYIIRYKTTICSVVKLTVRLKYRIMSIKDQAKLPFISCCKFPTGCRSN